MGDAGPEVQPRKPAVRKPGQAPRARLRRALLPLVVIAGFGTSGCVMPAAGSGGSATAKQHFLGGEIRSAPPRGYCTHDSSREEGGQAVILIGRCDGAEVAPALVTMSLGKPGSSLVLQSGAKALSDYFLSPQGRAALARDGKAASVRVSKTSLSEGALILRVSDRNAGAYWRAILGLKGRLVTISVSAPKGGELSEEEGRRILDATITSMRAANRGAKRIATEVKTEAGTAGATAG